MNEMNFDGFYRSTVTGAIHSLKHLQLTPEWGEIYQIENGDEANGGERGLANLQAIELGNRTEYLLKAVQSIAQYLMKGGNIVKVLESNSQPNDDSLLWLKYIESIDADFPVQLLATLTDGDTIDLLDGYTNAQIGNSNYYLQPQQSVPASSIDSLDSIDNTMLLDGVDEDYILSLFHNDVVRIYRSEHDE